MKTIKITLTVVVLLAITVSAIWGFMSLSKGDEAQAPINTHTKIIEAKISTLNNLSESSTSKNLYGEIKYYIEDDFSRNKLGATQLENDQMRNMLLNSLYATYAEKFLNQAFNVFKGSAWEIDKLSFIRNENLSLQREGHQNGFLELNGSIDKKFNEIKNIFTEYDKVNIFINKCKNISEFLDYEIATQFPIFKVEEYLKGSKEYLKSIAETNLLKNCDRLRNDLITVPQILFTAHVKYLEAKINQWSGKYVEQVTWNNYRKNLFLPLDAELEKIYQKFYSEDSSNIEFNRLSAILKANSTDAYGYFN
jgi:hypothetical protein